MYFCSDHFLFNGNICNDKANLGTVFEKMNIESEPV